jgi:hypothetical protein
MGASRAFLDGKLEDYAYPEAKVKAAMEKIPALT